MVKWVPSIASRVEADTAWKTVVVNHGGSLAPAAGSGYRAHQRPVCSCGGSKFSSKHQALNIVCGERWVRAIPANGTIPVLYVPGPPHPTPQWLGHIFNPQLELCWLQSRENTRPTVLAMGAILMSCEPMRNERRVWGRLLLFLFFIMWEAMGFAPRGVCMLVKDRKLLSES